MNTLSRLQAILRPESGNRGRRPPWRAIRVVVDETDGIDLPRVILSPGDRLLVENRTSRTLRVAPLDFFGNPFACHCLEPGKVTPPMVVTGLWFQVEVHEEGGDFHPLDVYLAPNGAA